MIFILLLCFERWKRSLWFLMAAVTVIILSLMCILSVSFSQVFRRPWPGIMRTLYENHERFENTYFKKFPGFYVTGDGETRASHRSIKKMSITHFHAQAPMILKLSFGGLRNSFPPVSAFCQAAGGIETATTGSRAESTTCWTCQVRCLSDEEAASQHLQRGQSTLEKLVLSIVLHCHHFTTDGWYFFAVSFPRRTPDEHGGGGGGADGAPGRGRGRGGESAARGEGRVSLLLRQPQRLRGVQPRGGGGAQGTGWGPISFCVLCFIFCMGSEIFGSKIKLPLSW